MVKYYKFFFLLFGIFILMIIPHNVYAEEIEQSKTINSSIGKFNNNYEDTLSLPLEVSNTSMTVGAGNYYYLACMQTSRTSFFRRYFINMTTQLVSGTSYHVRIVFFREFGINYSGSGLSSNRALNNKVVAQNNGANVTNLTSSITRQSSTASSPFNMSYDRFDIYFTANQNTTNLSISIGELTSTSYMYYSSLMCSSSSESLRMGVNGVYVWKNAVNSGTNEQDMIAQQQQSNSFLGTISQKITDFTIMVHNLFEDVKEKIDSFKQSFENRIDNFKNMVQQKFTDLIDFLTDTSLNSNTINNFFNSITPYENSSVAYPITSLLTFLGTPHSTCSPITLTTFNNSFQIPCGTTLFWNRAGVSDFRYIWCIIVGGGIVFSLGVKLFKIVQNAVNPKKDDLGGV